MLRSSVLRLLLMLALAPVVGAGFGLVAVAVWAASGDVPSTPRLEPAAVAVAAAQQDPGSPTKTMATLPAPAPESTPLTAEQAQAVAAQAAPGTVVEVDQDTEPQGLVWDVKVEHADGTETKVVVDAATGEVVRTEIDVADRD